MSKPNDRHPSTDGLAGTLRRIAQVLALAALVCLTPSATLAKIDVSHPDNPYDQVGVWHNQALDHVITETAQLQRNPILTLLAGHELVSEFTNQALGFEGLTGITEFGEIARLLRDRDAFNDELSARMDADQRASFEEFLGLLDGFSHAASDGEISDDEAAAVIDSFREFEVRVVASLGEERGGPLLAGASVARHSYAYWSHQISLGSNSPWARSGAPLPTVEDVLDPIATDAAGAVSGAIGGGISGAAVGGVGAIWGAFFGALESAAISSTLSWLSQFL